MTENNTTPILSRDDLTFTKRDDVGRLINWSVPHDPLEDWGKKFAIGQSYLDEIAELATHNEREAYLAVGCALSGGCDFRRGESTTFGNTGWGQECGFAEAIARAVIDGLRARRGGQAVYKPAPRPMLVEDAIGHFLACSKAFASLEVLLGEIDESDNLLAQGSLIAAGLGIAERYADLAERWRNDLKAGGLQS
ncbi:hypothetical protein [Candidatus Accumulibacter phosphatis]|uniref:Uncharacterized protein n=1 Tax=Candidatus Accumulibacter phosphatis TaxID=327160 RepID=A0A5S4EGL2_9PROT|nr:hypothetical protein [Candidatus Accumulibacter phosphatis]TMQ74384.1 hypothetical protein ACCUM_1704 [Candidatus Accumulibacter phosphatis]